MSGTSAGIFLLPRNRWAILTPPKASGPPRRRSDHSLTPDHRGLLNCGPFKPCETTMATPAPSLWANPFGTDGFAFIAYSATDPAALRHLFEEIGFSAIARHRSSDQLRSRQMTS